jgi:hypothetical protein
VIKQDFKTFISTNQHSGKSRAWISGNPSEVITSAFILVFIILGKGNYKIIKTMNNMQKNQLIDSFERKSQDKRLSVKLNFSVSLFVAFSKFLKFV